MLIKLTLRGVFLKKRLKSTLLFIVVVSCITFSLQNLSTVSVFEKGDEVWPKINSVDKDI